jgi:chromosomal replication initiator protein
MPTRIYLAEILAAVAARYGMTVEDLSTRVREREYVEPRQIGVYLCRQLTAASLSAIGSRVGYANTSDVAYAVRRVAARRAKDEKFDAIVNALIAELAALRAA